MNLDMSCCEAVSRLVAWLQMAGWQVAETFNLQNARLTQVHCPCPRHGNASCTCQMVVLQLFSRHSYASATLMLYGQDSWSNLSLVGAAIEQWAAIVQEAIMPAVSPQSMGG